MMALFCKGWEHLTFISRNTHLPGFWVRSRITTKGYRLTKSVRGHFLASYTHSYISGGQFCIISCFLTLGLTHYWSFLGKFSLKLALTLKS